MNISATILLASLALGTIRPASGQAHPSGTIVVSNMNDNTATVIDAATNSVRATVPTGEGPHEVAISRDGRWAAVSNYGPRGKPGNTLTVINVRGAAVERTVTINGYTRPHGMVFLPGDTLLVVTCESQGQLLVVDFRSGAVVANYPTAGRAPHILASTAAGDHLFTGNIGSGTIADVSLSGHDSAVVTRVGRQPEGVAVAPDGNTAWAGSNADSIVVVIDAHRHAPIDTLRGFGLPYRIAITPDSRTAVITDPMRSEIRIYGVADRKQRFAIAIPPDSLVSTAEVPGSASPEGVTTSRDNRWAFVTLQGRNRVITIDLESGRITGSAPTGTWSDGIGFSPIR